MRSHPDPAAPTPRHLEIRKLTPIRVEGTRKKGDSLWSRTNGTSGDRRNEFIGRYFSVLTSVRHQPNLYLMWLRAVLLYAALASAVAAQSPKEPWKLSLEERIALRTSAELARGRVRERARVQTSSPAANRAARPWVDEFDGKTHPELFLPHEVFRSLIHLAFLGSPRTGQVVRDGHMADVRRLGLPEDFWKRLEALSAVYIADSWAERDLGAAVQQQTGGVRGRDRDALTLKQHDVCRSRADALAAARKEFGPERFDRFLYEVIAVNKFHTEDHLPNPAVLRWTEAGCR